MQISNLHFLVELTAVVVVIDAIFNANQELMKKLSLLFSLLLLNPLVAQVQLGGDIDGEASGDYSGHSVSLSSDGTILAIGAYFNYGNGLESGHVRVYEYGNGNWTQLGSDIDGEAAEDWFGFSVSLSSDGTRVAIGALFNDGNGSMSGHVQVYEYNNGSWTQLGSDIDGEAPGDLSGVSVSLSSDGTRVAIGAHFNGDNGTESGHVRIYEYSTGSWIQIGADIDGSAAGDYLGYSVSLSSNGYKLAIGAPQGIGISSDSGYVRVYEYSAGSWTQLGADINGEAPGDLSGQSVSLSSDGTILAIGAPGNGNYSGQVRIFENSNGSWMQLGGDIDGEAANDHSGFSVSLSSKGDTVAIGAHFNDGNGLSSGHTRIYEYSTGGWIQLGGDIDGEAANDHSGSSVSLSSDGTKLAIGASANDGSSGNGSQAGHVRVYSIVGNTAGVNSTALEYNIQIYPNPTNDYLILDIPEEMIGQQYSFVITNAAGQSMYSDFLNQAQLQINLKHFASSGTHTLQIKDSGGNVVDTRVIILQ